nr:MAG TPA: RRNA intron-encoded endonuclease [Caudoviricetes sp.]
MKNVIARLAVPNSTLMGSARVKLVCAERFSCDRRKQQRRPKAPRPSEAGLPKIESIFEEDWLLGFTDGGAFSFKRRSIWQSKKTS